MNVTKNNIHPGMIITYAFSYSSRHPYFAQVTRVSKGGAWVTVLRNRIVSDDGYGQNGTVLPDLSTPGTPANKCFRFNRGGYLKVEGCYAYVFEGRPEAFYTD